MAGPAWVRTTEVKGEAGTPVTPRVAAGPEGGRRAGLDRYGHLYREADTALEAAGVAPSRWAPAAVVRTTPAAGSRARPAVSGVSPWWSWLRRTASIGGRSAMAIAGPVSLRELEPEKV